MPGYERFIYSVVILFSKTSNWPISRSKHSFNMLGFFLSLHTCNQISSIELVHAQSAQLHVENGLLELKCPFHISIVFSARKMAESI